MTMTIMSFWVVGVALLIVVAVYRGRIRPKHPQAQAQEPSKSHAPIKTKVKDAHVCISPYPRYKGKHTFGNHLQVDVMVAGKTRLQGDSRVTRVANKGVKPVAR